MQNITKKIVLLLVTLIAAQNIQMQFQFFQNLCLNFILIFLFQNFVLFLLHFSGVLFLLCAI